MYYVYKLTVGGQPYFGYTSRRPSERLEEHLKIAEKGKWKHTSKLYPLLREMELEHEFEVVLETTTEFHALCTEILMIREAGKGFTLNVSDGGEGSTMNVKTKMVDGKLQYKVVPRRNTKKRKSRPKRRRYRR